MKTIKIEDEVYKKLTIIKIELGKKTISEVINFYLPEDVKTSISHYNPFKKQYNFKDGEHDGNK